MHTSSGLIAALLVCSAAFAEDAKLTSTTNTVPELKAVYIKDVFTRGGKTNLVRNIKLKDGAVQIRIHTFYQDGERLCTIDYSPKYGQSIAVEPESRYGLHFLNSERDVFKYLAVELPEAGLVEGYIGTNGVFRPMTTAELKVNWIGETEE